jgi:catechol 2,3-dioxygenase-like lactoylglutathione lyase family enzyme
MEKLSILLLFLMVSMASCAINEEKKTAKESGSASFQPKPLDDDWSKWLVGEWKVVSGESSVTDESGKLGKIDLDEQGAGAGGFKIELGLNGQFLIMKSEAETGEMTPDQIKYFKDTLNYSDEDIERLKSNPYKALLIQTIDPKTGKRIGFLFDSMRCVAVGKGRLEGNREIIEWVWSATAQGATSVSITEKINDNKFTYNHKYILPNGNKMEDKVEFTRKKMTTERKEAYKMGIRFGMIAIYVNDLQKTVEFYRDVIGLEVKETAESYAEFNHDGIRFITFERMVVPKYLGITPAYPDGLNGTFELAIDLPYFEDVDREFDRVVKAGAKPVVKPKDMPWDQRSATIVDPDGNLIEFGSFNRGNKM